MKKIILSLAMVMAVMSASAQFRLEAGLSLGGFSKMGVDMSRKAGFFANALYDICVSDATSVGEYIEVGVGFLQNNVDVRSSISSGVDAGDLTTNWLNVPVLSRTTFKAGAGTIDIGVGLFYAFGLSGKINAGGGSLDVMTTDNAFRIFNRHDFGLMYRLGYTFDFGLGIQIGAQDGLINIANKDNGLEAKSRVFEASLCYFF